MVAGGYPPVVGHRSAARRDAWLGSYVTTMLQRDIRDLANIADATAVPQLLSVVADRAGGLLNFADLSARSLCRKRSRLGSQRSEVYEAGGLTVVLNDSNFGAQNWQPRPPQICQLIQVAVAVPVHILPST